MNDNHPPNTHIPFPPADADLENPMAGHFWMLEVLCDLHRYAGQAGLPHVSLHLQMAGEALLTDIRNLALQPAPGHSGN